MVKPKVCVLRTAGTNCDKETAFAFEAAGASSEFVHIKELVEGRNALTYFHILVLPGGFSYGDDIASGKILANELTNKLSVDLNKFILDGKLIIGICRTQKYESSIFRKGGPSCPSLKNRVCQPPGAMTI